jgi:hypothetical protein
MANYLIEFWRAARQRAAAGMAKPAWRQAFEAVELALVRKLGPRYYETAGLWRSDTDRSTRFGHINVAEYKAFVDRMNPPAYRKASQHKLIEKALLEAMGVPTAPLLGYVRRGLPNGPRRAGDADGFAATVAAFPVDRFAFKEVEGFGGRSFQAFAIERGAGVALRSLKDGTATTPRALWDAIAQSRNGFIAEAYIEQHAWYAALNASSVNTYRVWVVDAGGGGEVILSYLRMGRAGDLVDNKTAGGILAPVEAGRLGMATDASTARRTFANHPDSGTPIAGETPPLLDAVHGAAVEALAAFPGVRFAGVDVAVATSGPVVVELNVEPAREGAVRCDIPFKRWISERGI